MKRHSFDGLSFIAGMTFAGIGLAFLLIRDLSDLVDVFTDAGSWFWPLVLVVTGIAVIAPAVTKSRETKVDDEYTEELD